MNKYIQEALYDYDSAKRELEKFTKENTDFELSLDDGGYPLTFTFTPSVDSAQASIFEPDENAAVGSLRVICSSAGAGVDLGLSSTALAPPAVRCRRRKAQSSIICSVRSKMRRAIPPKHPKIPISTKRRVRQLSPSASASAISLLCAVRPVWIRLSTSATAPT